MPQERLQLYAIERSKHLPHDLYAILKALESQMHIIGSKDITEASAEALHAEDRASSPCSDDDDDGQGGNDDPGESSLPSPAAHRAPVCADLPLPEC